MTVTKEALDEIALSRAEYEAILDRLGREPSSLELGLFGALWSEHCGYKHSKPLLRLLPSESARLLVAPGAENAGVIDLGDGLAVAMKMESHNHPSAVEPTQGAATGVGGIVRDIFAMGARPIALLNSLRFGPPDTGRNRYLFSGVVAGISNYGNCIGIPNIGGEVAFAECYSENPLVNAMCIGLIENGHVVSAAPRSAGDVILLVGADTGRDGIHGASGLASRTFEEQAEMRSAVQVGNPFLEKVLIEACLEASKLDAVVGMQDLGAAGLTSAAFESARRAGLGLRIDVAKVPRREHGMTPYEVMLSESQERMLLMVQPGREAEVQAVFQKWDLWAEPIGTFIDGAHAEIYEGKERVARTPIEALTEPPLYEFSAGKPDWLSRLQGEDLSRLPLPEMSPTEVLRRLLASPNIASKRGVFRQYDHQVQTNTVVPPGGDAALLRMKGTCRGLAAATDGNGRHCYLDPYAGGAMAVAEACRNVVVTGAQPIAITDCLNFGDPETTDVQYQLTQAILGIKAACETLGVPVVSGNVSLYNESGGLAIYPTPVIGALGLSESVDDRASAAFAAEGDVVILLGASSLDGDSADLGGSEVLDLVHGRVSGRPRIDLELEKRVQSACLEAIHRGIVRSAHDCADGGLAVTVAESSILGRLGVRIDAPLNGRWDAALFGERASRIVLSIRADDMRLWEEITRRHHAQWMQLGAVEGDRIRFGDRIDIPVTDARGIWESALGTAILHRS